jgi:hypothetical protein
MSFYHPLMIKWALWRFVDTLAHGAPPSLLHTQMDDYLTNTVVHGTDSGVPTIVTKLSAERYTSFQGYFSFITIV